MLETIKAYYKKHKRTPTEMWLVRELKITRHAVRRELAALEQAKKIKKLTRQPEGWYTLL